MIENEDFSLKLVSFQQLVPYNYRGTSDLIVMLSSSAFLVENQNAKTNIKNIILYHNYAVNFSWNANI